MKIRFAQHAIDRYRERMAGIDAKAIEDWWANAERIAREIEKSGSWYYSPETGAHFCVVRNLKVYVAFLSRRRVTVVTAYPYTKKMKRVLNRCEHVPRNVIFPDN